MDATSSVAETATTTFATKAGYAVGTAGVAASAATAGAVRYWGYTADEWTVIAAFVSMVMAILGFLVASVTNFYFKWEHLQIARSLHKPDEEE